MSTQRILLRCVLFVKKLKIGLGRASGIINLLEKRTKIPVFVLEKRTKIPVFMLEKRTKTRKTPVKGISLSTFAVLQVTWSLYASIYAHISWTLHLPPSGYAFVRQKQEKQCLDKNKKNSCQRLKSIDFCSASSDMVFICKHLRPYLLNPAPSSVRLCLCQAKTRKTVVLSLGIARKSPPPAPPG